MYERITSPQTGAFIFVILVTFYSLPLETRTAPTPYVSKDHLILSVSEVSPSLVSTSGH